VEISLNIWSKYVSAFVPCFVSSPSFSYSAAEIEAVHEEVRADETLQFDFEAMAPPDFLQLRWLNSLIDFLSPMFPILSTLIEYAFWIGLAGLALAVVFVIAREVFAYFRNPQDISGADNANQYVPDTDFVKTLLGDADQLAGEGRYAEAIHLLLYRSIDDIQEQSARRIAGNLTSREIGQLPSLSSNASRAFEKIASHVEQCFFANKNADAQMFDECRDAYSRFSLQAESA
jgi:hypothetical protein